MPTPIEDMILQLFEKLDPVSRAKISASLVGTGMKTGLALEQPRQKAALEVAKERRAELRTAGEKAAATKESKRIIRMLTDKTGPLSPAKVARRGVLESQQALLEVLGDQGVEGKIKLAQVQEAEKAFRIRRPMGVGQGPVLAKATTLGRGKLAGLSPAAKGAGILGGKTLNQALLSGAKKGGPLALGLGIGLPMILSMMKGAWSKVGGAQEELSPAAQAQFALQMAQIQGQAGQGGTNTSRTLSDMMKMMQLTKMLQSMSQIGNVPQQGLI